MYHCQTKTTQLKSHHRKDLQRELCILDTMMVFSWVVYTHVTTNTLHFTGEECVLLGWTASRRDVPVMAKTINDLYSNDAQSLTLEAQEGAAADPSRQLNTYGCIR